MKTMSMLTQLLIYVAKISVCINFAIDYKSPNSIASFSLLIILFIVDFILLKMNGQDVRTIFDYRLFNVCLNALLLAVLLFMYIQNKDHLSVFYLATLGLSILYEMVHAIKQYVSIERLKQTVQE